MDEHDGGAGVEFGPQRFVVGIAEIFAAGVGQQNDAIGVQHVQRVNGLGNRSVHVGQRDAGELAEAVGPPLDQLRMILVHLPRQGAAFRVVGQVDARGAEGKDAGRDRFPVHHGDSRLRVPIGVRPAASGQPAFIEQLAVCGRDKMLMGVDPGG